MNDPIKNFVGQHREEFDDFEPPADVLDKVRKEIRLAKISTRRNNIYRLSKWVVAASILITLGIYFYVIPKDDSVVNEVSKNTKKITPKSLEPISWSPKKEASVNPVKIVKPAGANGLEKSENKALMSANVTKALYQNEKDSILLLLSDEQSSSNRIYGLVKASKLPHIKETLMETIVKHATEDENSNVRLVAIDVIISRLDQPYMAKILRRTFVEQDDPFVLTELIDAISNMDANKIDKGIKDKLVALTDDPKTMGFVKDRAYAVLMSTNDFK